MKENTCIIAKTKKVLSSIIAKTSDTKSSITISKTAYIPKMINLQELKKECDKQRITDNKRILQECKIIDKRYTMHLTGRSVDKCIVENKENIRKSMIFLPITNKQNIDSEKNLLDDKDNNVLPDWWNPKFRYYGTNVE